MERSDLPDDDASGDASGDPSGDEEYPLAPLPAHERTWRHPSELGQAGPNSARGVWAHTDPPITIGRGLLLTTGAIGGLLSLAVLWAMLPSAGHGGVAAPTVVTSRANDLPSSNITARADTLIATSVETRLPPSTLDVDTAGPTTAAPETTTPNAEQPQATVGTTSTELTEAPPVAVGIGDSMVITTARAVDGRTTLTLTDGNGKPHEATVLMVDRDRGLAVLSASAAAVTTSFGVGPAAGAGDVVTVLGPTSTSATVRVAADGHLTLDAWDASTPEGAPIVNGDGQLVGICSHGESGFEVISVANVGEMLAPAKPPKPAAWLGVHVTANDSGAPTVDRVDPNGPAASVGLVAGDVVTAADGVAIATVDDLKATIAALQPNDAVTLSVTHPDGTTADVAVTLGTTPSM